MTEFVCHLTDQPVDARIDMPGPRAMSLRLNLGPGLYQLDLHGKAGCFDPKHLFVTQTLWDGHKQVFDPDAPPVGPMDWIGGKWYVPRYHVTFDGRSLGELWFDLPSPRDMRQGVLRTSMGFVVEQAGEHELVFESLGEPPLLPSDLARLVLSHDERGRVRDGAIRVPDVGPVLYGQSLAKVRHSPESYREMAGRLARHFQHLLNKPDAGFGAILTDQQLQMQLRIRVDAALLDWLMGNDPHAAMRAIDAAMQLCACPVWGQGEPGDMGADNDMGCGFNLVRVSRVYDWLRGELDTEQRRLLRDQLIKRTQRLYDFFVLQRSYLPGGYLQNHFCVTCLGLLSASMALMREHPPARRWARLAWSSFLISLSLHPVDGSTMPLEVRLGVPYVARAIELVRDATGVLPNVSYFRDFVGFCEAGQYKISASTLALIGRWFDDSQLQAAAANRRKVVSLGQLLFVDPKHAGASGKVIAGRRIYHDGGYGFLERDRWFVRLFAGHPFSRTHFSKLSRYNFAHDCPARGHFELHVDSHLVIGQAHGTYHKTTDLFNCLIVNDQPQHQNGFCWLTKDEPEHYPAIGEQHDGQGYRMITDVACAYPEQAGLIAARRDVIYPGTGAMQLLDQLQFERDGNGVRFYLQSTGRIDAVGEDAYVFQSQQGHRVRATFVGTAPKQVRIDTPRIVHTYRKPSHPVGAPPLEATFTTDARELRILVNFEVID